MPLTASAVDDGACICAADCTGTYVNGFCSADPTHYQPAVEKGVGVNGRPLYEISNAGQLFWFAAWVNENTVGVPNASQKQHANAILGADIDLNPGYTFTFIPDTGLVEIKQDGVAIAYLGTGKKGDDSGSDAGHGAANCAEGGIVICKNLSFSHDDFPL